MQYEDFEYALEEFATYKRTLEETFSRDSFELQSRLETKKSELWKAITEENIDALIKRLKNALQLISDGCADDECASPLSKEDMMAVARHALTETR